MKNIPKKIYLQIGEDCDAENFNDLGEVTWNDEKVFENDIEYANISQITVERIQKIVEKYAKNNVKTYCIINTLGKNEVKSFSSGSRIDISGLAKAIVKELINR